MKNYALFFLLFVMLDLDICFAQNLYQRPESVVYDYEHSRYLVSDAEENHGDIVQVDEFGEQSYLTSGLEQSLGLHIVDSVLYVACGGYGYIKGFHLETGLEIMSLSFDGAQLVNDITSDNNGYLYVTDSQAGRVYKVNPSENSYTIFADEDLTWANGILFDEANNRLIVCQSLYNSPIKEISLVDSSVNTIIETDFVYFDGITVDSQGNYYLTSSSAIHKFNNDFSEPAELVYQMAGEPADLFFNTEANVLAVPYLEKAVVDYMWLPNVAFNDNLIAQNFTTTMSVRTADFNNDNFIDVVGAAYTANGVTWWQNDGNQTFTEHPVSTGFGNARTVYAADIDSDNDMDILGAAYSTNKVSWWENDGSANFTEHNVADDYEGSHTAYATDIDKDGDIDILGAAWDDVTKLWINDGSEGFTEQNISTHIRGTSVMAIDVGNDGDMDIFDTEYSGTGGITFWENNGEGVFDDHFFPFAYVHWVYALDLDRDSDIDFLGASCGNKLKWWKNNGNQDFTSTTIATGFSCASSVFAADLDLDGDMDVLSTAEELNDVSWWENDGNQNFQKHVISDSLDGASDVYAADIDGDHDLDIFVAANDDNEIRWFENKIYDSPNHAPLAHFFANKSEIAIHKTVTFTNYSYGDITTYEWNFGAAANPQTATGQGPHEVVFSSAGKKIIELKVTGPNGFDIETKELEVNYGINVKEIDSKINEDFKIFPNPNKGSFEIEFNIEGAESVDLKIYNISGQVVYTDTVHKAGNKFKKQLNLNNMAKGIYEISIASKTTTLTKKIAIE